MRTIRLLNAMLIHELRMPCLIRYESNAREPISVKNSAHRFVGDYVNYYPLSSIKKRILLLFLR